MDLIETNDRAQVFRMHSGDLLAIPHAPNSAEALHAIDLFATARAQLAQLEDARRAFSADPRLSQQGRAEKIEAQRAQVEKIVGEMAAKAEEFAKNSEAALAAATAPPPLARDDTVGFLQDQELRGLLRNATDAQRAELLAEVADGGPLAVAVARSPVGLRSYAEAARAALAAKGMATDAGKKAKSFTEAAAWARQVFAQLAPHVAGQPQPIVRRVPA